VRTRLPPPVLPFVGRDPGNSVAELLAGGGVVCVWQELTRRGALSRYGSAPNVAPVRKTANLALAFALIAAALVCAVGIVSYAKASNSLSPISTLTTKLGSEYMVSCRHPRRLRGGCRASQELLARRPMPERQCRGGTASGGVLKRVVLFALGTWRRAALQMGP